MLAAGGQMCAGRAEHQARSANQLLCNHRRADSGVKPGVKALGWNNGEVVEKQQKKSDLFSALPPQRV